MIAAVVVAFRRPGSLARTLASVASIDDVVVVNVTDDVDVSHVATAHGARVVATTDNVGFGRAVNVGVDALADRSTRVLVLNDDVEVRALPAGGEATIGAHVLVPVHEDRDGRQRNPLHPLPTPSAFARWWVAGIRRYETTLLAANGSATLISREVLDAVPFPEDYFLYWEEVSWYWRLHDLGIAPTYSPSFVVSRPPGSAELGDLKSRLLGANLVRLGRERYGQPGRVGYFALGVCWVLRLLATDLISPKRGARWRARRWMMVGLVDGLLGRPPGERR